MEPDRSSQDVLDNMSVEEKWAKLVLEQAESNEPSNISECIEPDLTGPGEPGGVEPSLARLVEQGSCLISKAGTTKLQV